MKAGLQRAWLRRGPLACLLWPVALLFGALVRLRRNLYRTHLLRSEKLPVPVVVVGNVVAGGAGKTPTVIALVQHLQAAGIRAGVVSRGYGRRGNGCLEVLPETPPELSGDEPALIRRATQAPVFVAARRADAARALLAAHPATQLIICDDGLQHYALQRDIEIAVFDERGAGNGWLLPAGPLREPWPERLQRGVGPDGRGIDLVLHTGALPAFDGFRSTRRLADHALRADGSRVALDSLAGTALIALAGIASPQAFFDMLKARGLALAETRALPDHYDFDSYPRPSDMGYTLICTEKDAVKLFPLQTDALAVPLVFEPEPAFFAAFDALLASRISPLPSSHGHKTA
ncbi:MAG: tetraacyldisaccharide 4'-kinase [Hydrogenophaga sp.]|uniref:tetraacyldisaccharide 4'-kinase n=1 Tax=Hydrogenophaga sp. TaxID=1904254 RepID=UPI0027307D32|nr:tetraacyldisaccharide 4'-kinase [Hydrogenophaga sp.]MDP2163028.1 tetraacyldisaccharide 4'-kinase [Hydrogenophaga sp.]